MTTTDDLAAMLAAAVARLIAEAEALIAFADMLGDRQ